MEPAAAVSVAIVAVHVRRALLARLRSRFQSHWGWESSWGAHPDVTARALVLFGTGARVSHARQRPPLVPSWLDILAFPAVQTRGCLTSACCSQR